MASHRRRAVVAREVASDDIAVLAVGRRAGDTTSHIVPDLADLRMVAAAIVGTISTVPKARPGEGRCPETPGACGSAVTLTVETFVLALDLFGTFVFALSGATVGVRRRLDLFGVLVLAFAAGTAGGIIRDLVIGAVPPSAFADWRYIVVPMVAGLATFWWHPLLRRLHSPVLVFDAAGLGLFAVSGALKALAFGLNPVAAVALGMLTGIGGGMARDLLVAEVPNVLRAEVYAVAALAGAAVAVVGHLLPLPSAPVAILGAALCFGLRLGAIRRGWQLPIPPSVGQIADARTRDARSGRG